jgi:hypothetical protein
MTFLLFLILVPLLIGAIPFSFGIVLISGRGSVNTRKNQYYKTDLVIGIVLIVIGTSVANIPMAFDVVDMTGTVQTIFQDKMRLDFYNAYVKSDATVDATEASAYESGFDYNGMHYTRVNGMKVTLHDPFRKDAAAIDTKADEKKTLFRYENQSGCDLLCLKYSIYCPDEQINTLDEFFRDGELTYVCLDNSRYSKSVEENITDGYFFCIYDMDPSVVEACSGDHSQYKYLSSDPTAGFMVTQISGDKELERSFCVEIGIDDEVYIYSISAFSGSNSSDVYYRVIDPSFSRYFLDLNMEVNSY